MTGYANVKPPGRARPTRRRVAPSERVQTARRRRALHADERAGNADLAVARHYRRVSLLAALLGIVALAAAGADLRRDRATVPATRAARQAVAAPAAPRCADGRDDVRVVAQSPHGSGAALDSAIAVTFSCLVDRRAVERAFVLYPVTAGSFTWEGETMTFHPAGPLLPMTPYRVTLFDGLSDSRGFVNGRKASWPFLTRASP